MNLDLDPLIAILNGNDAATEAAYQALPPAFQHYVDTGDSSGVRAYYAERGMNPEFFDAMGDSVVSAVNAATVIANRETPP